VKRIAALLLLAGVVAGATGCSADDGPGATVKQVDKARHVQTDTNERTRELQQQIQGLQP
jgi:hypothetical protein